MNINIIYKLTNELYSAKTTYVSLSELLDKYFPGLLKQRDCIGLYEAFTELRDQLEQHNNKSKQTIITKLRLSQFNNIIELIHRDCE